jgi:hypothetical protein
MAISITITQRNDFESDELRTAVTSALDHELSQAKARREFYAQECREFEERYAMSSDVFLNEFEAGNLGDDEYLFIWFGYKSAFDLWDRRMRVLEGVTVEPE